MSDTKPADEIRIGRIKATIWLNPTEDGRGRYNVVFAAIYRDSDDQWHTTHSFGLNDLLLLAKLVDLAHTRVYNLRQDDAAQAGAAQADAAAATEE